MIKKIIIFLTIGLLIKANIFGQVIINETNFPDAVFREWLLVQSYGKDGIITDEEIESITKINVFWQGISDLTGIKYFTNLQELRCDYNYLTFLDVSGLSKLQLIWCSDNLLKSLDVSDLFNLQILYCSRNQLTSLDVTDSKGLEILDCEENRLSFLGISELTKLWSLYCYLNELTFLDVSKLTNLRDLWCSYNNLASLSVSHLSKLLYLDCSNNKLTSLEVSGLAFLWYLNCSFNQLTSLDFAGLVGLETLICHNNQLTDIYLGGIDRLSVISLSYQKPTLTLRGSKNNYSATIYLNNPTNLVSNIKYENGILTSSSSDIKQSAFAVETGRFTKLSGTFTFQYEEITNLPAPNSQTRKAKAFYSITGVKLEAEPQKGIFIVVYDDGETKIILSNRFGSYNSENMD